MAVVETMRSMLVVSLGLACGCAQDSVAADGGSESGSSTAAGSDGTSVGGIDSGSDDASSSGVADSSSSGSSSSSDASTGTGTTGDEAGPPLTVIYGEVVGEDMRSLQRVEYVDGALGAPSLAFDAVDPSPFVSLVGPRRLLVREMMPFALTLQDLDAPAAPHVFDVPNAPASVVERVDDRWLVRAYGSGTDLLVYTVADDGDISVPWQVDADLAPELEIGSDAALVRDGEAVVFVGTDPVTDEDTLWLGPGHDLAPPAVALATDADVTLMNVSPSGDALYYASGGNAVLQASATFVDLSVDPAGAPIELPLLADTAGIHRTRWAADGSAIMMIVEHGDDSSDAAWYAVADGTVDAPVQLSVGDAAGRVEVVRDSPDARWLSLLALSPDAVYLARLEGGVVGPAVEVAGEADGVDVGSVEFSPTGAFLMLAMGDAEGHAVPGRVPLDGDAPGAWQALTPPMLAVWQVLASDDESTVFASGYAIEDEQLHGYLVDVSSGEPGAPLPIDTGVAADESLLLARFSSDANYLVYTVRKPGPANAYDLRAVLFDRVSGLEHSIGDGVSISGTPLLSLQ